MDLTIDYRRAELLALCGRLIERQLAPEAEYSRGEVAGELEMLARALGLRTTGLWYLLYGELGEAVLEIAKACDELPDQLNWAADTA